MQTGCFAVVLLAVTSPVRAASDTVVYSFKGLSDGAYPEAGLINVGGTLFGTTTQGGANRLGTVFKVTASGVETSLHSFKGSPDGALPFDALLRVGDALYGTTSEGGAYGQGSVFRVTVAGVKTVLYSFKGGSDGSGPNAGLINVGGTLFGTTVTGGARNLGTVFKLTTAGAESVAYSFKGGSDAAYPSFDLIDVGGILYGTTGGGGASSLGAQRDFGTVFKLTQAGTEKVIHRFKGGSDGASPVQGLVNVRGTLYGITVAGGGAGCFEALGCGTVFKVTKAGSEAVVYSFKGGSDGSNPDGLADLGGALYGTTYAGGGTGTACPSTSGCGTVFSVTPAGAEKMICAFRGGSDGQNPSGGVIKVGGMLYGTTQIGGGPGNYGTVFSVKP